MSTHEHDAPPTQAAQATSNGPDLAAAAALVVGPLCLVVGIILLVWNWIFLSDARSARGKVINLIETSTSDGTSYKPEIQYAVPGGETYTRTTTWATNPPVYAVGDEVDVLYDPDDPGTMVPDSFWSKWLMTLIFLGVGNIFTIIGFVKARRADAAAGYSSPI